MSMMKPVLALATAGVLLAASLSSSAFAAQLALRERQKKCGAEWKEAKAAGNVEAGMKWPQYWSACNKRLKGA
jgi:hypothetical protein